MRSIYTLLTRIITETFSDCWSVEYFFSSRTVFFVCNKGEIFIKNIIGIEFYGITL